MGAFDYPWDHPAVYTVPISVGQWLKDARLFSFVHQGTLLLYSLMLAECLEDEDGIGSYSTGLAQWSESLSATEPVSNIGAAVP